MLKNMFIEGKVHAGLLKKKSEIIAVEGKNLTFSDIIERLLKNDA